jgi:predicted nucleic acid-binding protein
MSGVFADTSFFVAYLNPRDESHELAHGYMTTYEEIILTTSWVLVELGNYLAKGRNRRLLIPLIRRFNADRRSRLIPPDTELFEKGLALYGKRPDKEWSLTDCISFVVMKREGLIDALTGDHHFEQAGFKALLK